MEPGFRMRSQTSRRRTALRSYSALALRVAAHLHQAHRVVDGHQGGAADVLAADRALVDLLRRVDADAGRGEPLVSRGLRGSRLVPAPLLPVRDRVAVLLLEPST